MNIKKCDFCEKELKDSKHVGAGIGLFLRPDLELCFKCGEPILKFLRKYKIIDKDNNKIKGS